jgi:cytochrome P450
VDFDVYDHSLALRINEVMRDYPPVTFSPKNGGHWIVCGYEAIRAVLNDPTTFPSYPQSIPPEVGAMRGRFIPLEYDPPLHGDFRQMLRPLFAPRQMELLAGRLESLANGLIDGFASRGECEFVSEFANPFPAIAFLTLMGWPLDQREQFCAWVDAFIFGAGGEDADADAKARGAAIEAVYAYFAGFVEQAREAPGDDFTGLLLQATMSDGRRLTQDEILNFLFLLMIAGLHTVQGSFAYSMMHFSRMPDERRRVIEDPSALPAAVEEMLRLEPPAWGVARAVGRDVDLGGAKLRTGDLLLVPVQTANRDAAKFADPDAFHRDRPGNPHLTFGGGPHRCIGSHLARLELRVGLAALNARLADYRIDGDRPLVAHMGQVRGVSEMHLTFTPEAASPGRARPAGGEVRL